MDQYLLSYPITKQSHPRQTILKSNQNIINETTRVESLPKSMRENRRVIIETKQSAKIQKILMMIILIYNL